MATNMNTATTEGSGAYFLEELEADLTYQL